MEKILNVRFDNSRIYVTLDNGKEYGRPLEAFPILLQASPSQREAFEIGRFGDDLRWKELDEDIHVSSFFETTEPNPDNIVAKILAPFPWIDLSEVASGLHISKNLLLSYLYGMKEISDSRLQLLRETLHQMGKKLLTA